MKNWTFPLLALPALLSLSTSLLAQTLRQEAYLKASNTDPGDRFGRDVAMDGDTVLVLASGEDSAALTISGDQSDNSVEDRGAAYVFVRGDGGEWIQQAYLKSPVLDERFSGSIALQGDTAVISHRPYLGDWPRGRYGAYIFVRDDSGEWLFHSDLRASNEDGGDGFGDPSGWGDAIAIDGHTMVIGADHEDSASREINGDDGNSGDNNGAAYVFVRNEAGEWSQQAYLKPSDGQDGDWFGRAVAIDGNTVVVSSHRGGGPAYVFVRDESGTWSEQAILRATNREEGDVFARSLAIDGDTIAIGAWSDDSGARGIHRAESSGDEYIGLSGAVHVFVRDQTGRWRLQAYMKSESPQTNGRFGQEVVLQGDTLFVDTRVDNSQYEVVFLYQRDESGGWHQAGSFRAFNPVEGSWGELFGDQLAIDGGMICVSAGREDSAATGINGDQDDDSAEDAGAVYVFSLQPSSGVFSVERRSDGEIELDFDGTLQRSTDLLNWLDLDPQPLSPWRFMPSEAAEYFRAQQDQ